MKYILLLMGLLLLNSRALAATCTEGETKKSADACTHLVCVEGYWAGEIANEGLPCNDGNPCTSGDVCRTGECVGRWLKGFDDKNPCTTASCDPSGGVKHEPIEDKALGPCKVGAGNCAADGEAKCVGGKYICTPFVETKINACGGCTELTLKLDEPCGQCGKYVCKGTEEIVCQEGKPNACGTCGTPPDEDGDGVPDCLAECRSNSKGECQIENLKGVCAAGEKTCLKGKWGRCVAINKPAKEICDNKLDDDCDGLTDFEDSAECVCIENMLRRCYSGPPITRGVGVCADGYQTCRGGGWGVCAGEVKPGQEVCNGLDDDCNGRVDEGCV